SKQFEAGDIHPTRNHIGGGGDYCPHIQRTASTDIWLTVCRQSISDNWLGNLRECLAHLV
ncbi:MAG: hypothetical protein WAN68_16535, partial [Pseudolabrys sp.]